MSNTKQEILSALQLDDFTPYDYYADDYTGERDWNTYDNLDDASVAFKRDCEEVEKQKFCGKVLSRN